MKTLVRTLSLIAATAMLAGSMTLASPAKKMVKHHKMGRMARHHKMGKGKMGKMRGTHAITADLRRAQQ